MIEVYDFTPEQVEANRTGKLIYMRIPMTVRVRDRSGFLKLSRSYVFAWGIQKEGFVKFKGFPEDNEKGEEKEESDSD